MGIHTTNQTVAMVIEKSNVALIAVVAVFAVLGVIGIIQRKSRRNAFLFAYCAAALAALGLEATVFNAWHYLKYFSGPPIGGVLEQSEAAPNMVIVSDGTKTEMIPGGVRFININERVASIFVDVGFKNNETEEMNVQWTDEGIAQQYTKKLYKYLPHENYVPLQSCGKVSDIAVTFKGASGSSVDVNEIVINKPIPFYFSGLRLLVVSLLLFAVFAIVSKNLRAKAAYYLFEYRFEPENEKQKTVYNSTVVLCILFSGACAYTSFHDGHIKGPWAHQYGKYLVDALIAGRTYLDYGHPEILLDAKRPYDATWRRASGYEAVAQNNGGWDWDFVWYKGKYYCYFGVVPAVLLYVPYKIVTGKYLSNHAGILFFCAVSVVLMAALWRHCVRKYMPDIRYAFYLLSFLTLFFASGLFATLRYTGEFYGIARSAGLMFTVAGVLLLLKSIDKEKINHLTLFLGCLCLALVFGCRPNMGLASLFVPVILWRYRTWKTVAFAVIPYVIVAVPLCAYNYARFDSIFDFGVNYMLTSYNAGVLAQQNPLGKVFRIFMSSAHYLLGPLQFSPYFPFVEALPGVSVRVTSGILWFNQDPIGMVNFPIVFCLFYIFKNIFGKDKPKTIYALSASLIAGMAIIVLNSAVTGCAGRYMQDFAVFIIFPSLFCAYYWCQDSLKNGDVCMHDVICWRGLHALRVAYVLMGASVFVGLFLCVSALSAYTYSNPTLYRYLEYSLSFFQK